MGFHVNIDESEISVLKTLKSNPAAIFDATRPYGGYLIFLIGGESEEELYWLRNNVVNFDSITGKSVAFFVFARRFPVTIHVPYLKKQPNRPKAITEVPLEEFSGSVGYDVQRLVHNGRCGWVLDGDEVSAVSYATDQVAREFNVFAQLPCVIVLDAIPHGDYLVYSLGDGNFRIFNQLLRRVIARFERAPGFLNLMETLAQLAQTRRRKDELNKQLETLASAFEPTELSQRLETIRQLYKDLNDSLLNAELRKSRQLCERLFYKGVSDQTSTNVIQVIQDIGPELLRACKTIRALRRYLDMPWPLVREQEDHFKKVWSRYVTASSITASDSPPNDPKPITDALHRLLKNQVELVDQVFSHFPKLNELKESTTVQIKQHKKLIEEQISATEASIGQMENIRQQASQILASASYPLFTQAFARENSRAKVVRASAQLTIKLRDYLAKWCDPEVLAKLLPSPTAG